MKPSYQDYKQPEELKGKTIESCNMIRAEWARTSENYLIFKFTDGTRHLVGVHNFTFHQPDPEVCEMRKAQDFFTKDEIVAKFESDEIKSRRIKEDQLRRKREQLKALKRELGER